VVLFGAGVHVATLRALKYVIGVGWCVRTEEGNTSSGNSGSQSDGGMSTPRLRLLTDVHGFARVDYPGGRVRRAASTARLLGGALIPARASKLAYDVPLDSDVELAAALAYATHPDAIALRDELAAIVGA
jgi:hypothetical protein